MGQGEIDSDSILRSFYDQTHRKLLHYREKYPILYDYCNLKEKEMSEVFDAYQQGGTLEYRKLKFGALLAICFEVSISLQQMDAEGFTFLYDERLWPMLRTAITENNLPINHKWTKSLIAANILELAINDITRKLDREKYEELNRKNAGLDTRFRELNSLLASNNMERYKLKVVEFDALRSVRNAADHPDPDILKEIDDEHVKKTIDYAHYALSLLRQVLDELDRRGPSTF